MKLYIKNMVCDRCILVVKNTFENLGLKPVEIKLGEVELNENKLSEKQLNDLNKSLTALGFERMNDRKSQLISKMKSLIIKTIHHSDKEIKYNWSELITSELPHDYNYLSRLFSSVEGITFEQYIILQKIEKVKELLVYDELTLKEIAWKLDYSSVSHLSSQFKKVTGLTTSHFRNLKDKKRKPLDGV